MSLNHLFDIPTKTDLTDREAGPSRVPREFPAIVGVDLSMTNTGVAAYLPTFDDPADGYEEVRLHRIQSKPEDWATGPLEALKVSKRLRPSTTWEDRRRRMEDLVRRVTDVTPDGSLVFLEAPSYAPSGSGTFDRSGLWWWLYSELAALQCVVVPVSPAQRMLYATGKGGGKDAGKDAVIAAVVRRYPDLTVTDNNVADAVVLMMMARRAAGVPHEAKLAVANLKALDKLDLSGLVGA